MDTCLLVQLFPLELERKQLVLAEQAAPLLPAHCLWRQENVLGYIL